MKQRRLAYLGMFAMLLYLGAGCSSPSDTTPGQPSVSSSSSVSPDDEDDSSDDMDACACPDSGDESPGACSSAAPDACSSACPDSDSDSDDCDDGAGHPSGSPSGPNADASDAAGCMDDSGTPGNLECEGDVPGADSSGDEAIPCPSASDAGCALPAGSGSPPPKAVTTPSKK